MADLHSRLRRLELAAGRNIAAEPDSVDARNVLRLLDDAEGLAAVEELAAYVAEGSTAEMVELATIGGIDVRRSMALLLLDGHALHVARRVAHHFKRVKAET